MPKPSVKKDDLPIYPLETEKLTNCLLYRPVNGKTFKLNTRYTKRSARPGDNSLKPGDWFPYQMAALFNGAHGSAQSGVVGDDKYGAHSIVLSGKYKDVDDE